MASEVISHAIFASFHLTPPRTALSFTPPSTPRFAPHLTLHLALHFTPHPTLHSPPALHSSPYSAQPCTHPAPHCLPLRLPPRAPLHISPCTPTLHPIMRFTQRPDPHSPPPISIALLCSPGFL